jgi:hypothetical protein
MTYNTGVRRAFSITLLVASLLLAGTLQAQHAGSAGRESTGFSGHSGSHQGHSGGRNLRDGTLYPYWDGGLYWDNQATEDEQAAPAPMMMRPGQSRPVVKAVSVASPKVIDLPVNANAVATKSLPSAIFVLDNGERLETRQYLLTHDNLYVTIDRQQRTVPLKKLNIGATTVVNRERGIELRIPSDRNEIYLSF